ncbi:MULTISPECIES: carbohydrate ABC transporter permease [Brevibacillus]|jgi:raffinose/stachyose/melibiose transport system permease protein|uniref:Binding-protein-dependent transport system inner membrane protein n=1 Tax=Brevibacillus borstelensis AK1 TaxID=1300222 RepID=M8E8X9_9BACL|nr:carbohydrate ABC transporter permease [Brevibacillus borstelensis]EMT51935.1 binding-protein-dependent transport system inner membrane protein [Brevibacillus borstelensis AK1]KKX56463.1 sugar ABC transporter permease [Brevibacillus borstelensis cifa_chp40]MBE5398260.1 carbohydrate ABC transporter permease [Brevibacillus borstelensis]MCC0564744.1 carbohydrate ABC transporter permease [Brevibacillus borstelensis]MCM3468820.1 carbohydrate ABC transporter permease [Brevibacillus borstelensis]
MRTWLYRRNVIPHMLLTVYVLVTLYPLVWLAISSLKTQREITESPWGLPSSFQWQNYVEAWKTAKVSTYFFNSLYISTVSCILIVIIGSAAAFAITRMNFPRLSNWVYQFFLLGLVVPGGALLIPLYRLLQEMKLIDTHLSLILINATFALPVTIFILSAFMKAIPRELEEAAIVDGLGAFGLFVRIILPVTMPAIVTVFILNFINVWNEFIMALLFLSKETLRTLPVGMSVFKDAFQTNYALLSAAVMYSVVPVVIVYLFLQRKIIEGVTAGSVKG